jgi:prevent-host-death family protein
MKTKAVGTLEAKTRFSELLGQVERGCRFLITRHGRPIAELAPLRAGRRRPSPGFAKGCFTHVADDFDAPLADFQDHSL